MRGAGATRTLVSSILAGVRGRLTLTIFYDGWCPFCARSIGWLARLDLLSLVRWVSFRDPGVVEQYHLNPRAAECRIQSLAASGASREGIDAMVQVALRLPLLWPAVPLLAAARLLAGQRAYDAIASRRLVLIPGACRAHCGQGAPRVR